MFEEIQGELYQMNECCSFRVDKCQPESHKPINERKTVIELLNITREQREHRFLLIERVETLNYAFF